MKKTSDINETMSEIEENLPSREVLEQVLEGLLAAFREMPPKSPIFDPETGEQKLSEAFWFASEAHGAQKRKDGSPYITHPTSVAKLVIEMHLDEDAIRAALLHDVVEDTAIELDTIRKMFGDNVAEIVDGLTKISKIHFSSGKQAQHESVRKMLVAMTKDIRVIIIKIADRVHNMRTLQFQSPAKQLEKAQETLDIYAPLAHRLGMQKFKWELEDISMRYLHPEQYSEIEQSIKEKIAEIPDFFNTVEGLIEDSVQGLPFECRVKGRTKHVYSIYRKMLSQNKPFSEILDIFAFRIVISGTDPECFTILGRIHNSFRPIPGTFKDYISYPKPNGYQSLHTTVLKNGVPFEIQIRTEEMDAAAEQGISAHWKYKAGVTKSGDEADYAWVRRLVESFEEEDPDESIDTLKMDMFSDQVLVLTPQGDVRIMPTGATPIDFAYAIHSKIGNSMTGAKVNGAIVSIRHPLKSGDIVEILRSKTEKGPSRDWLNIIKTSEARNKIRLWFKQERREENITHGKASFESELKKSGFSLQEFTGADALPELLKKLGYPTADDFFAAIGYGGISSQRSLNKIREELLAAKKESLKAQLGAHGADLPEPPVPPKPRKNRSSMGVIIEGQDDCLVKFAKCCSPLPGDEIIGFTTRGFGVSIHRADCKNYIKSAQNAENNGRWLSAAWDMDSIKNEGFTAALKIFSMRNDGIVNDITSLLRSLKVRYVSIAAKDTPDGGAFTEITVADIKPEMLDTLTRRIGELDGVYRVDR